MISGNGCACCGSPEIIRHADGFMSPRRCAKHATRNPCAIEGCKRTREAPLYDDGSPYISNMNAICGPHWRLYVPARTRVRRAYHAHFSRAKRIGWTPKSERAFDLFWRRLITLARRRAEAGHIDEDAINRLMGWK